MKEAQELRARRRYRALLREAQKLQQQGQTDERLALELQKLLQDFPTLEETVGAAGISMNEMTSRLSNQNVVQQPSNGAPSPSAVSRCSLEEEKGGSRCFAAVPSPSSSTGTAAAPAMQTDGIQAGRKSCSLSPLSGGTTLLFGALSIYSEAHLPSSLRVSSYFVIVFLSILVAVLHRFTIEPSHPAGKALSPILLGCFVHIHNLIALHLQRPKRISKAMLFIYLILDVLPSMLLVFVVYILTGLCMDLMG